MGSEEEVSCLSKVVSYLTHFLCELLSFSHSRLFFLPFPSSFRFFSFSLCLCLSLFVSVSLGGGGEGGGALGWNA